ncbi:hypothetical protein JHK85_010236 [Glycine max]|nr:hypothetical protein JHK85_010236 [Glycine max]
MKLLTYIFATSSPEAILFSNNSPSLVARGLSPAQATVGSEQIQIQVPNEKVGLIIGRSGETIKSLQTKSGVRIQLIPQHLSEGDDSKERTVQVTGDKRQIQIAQELIKEVMNQVCLTIHAYAENFYNFKVQISLVFICLV